MKRFHFGGGPVYLLFAALVSLSATAFAGEVCVMPEEDMFYDIPQEWTELDAMRGSEQIRKLIASAESNLNAVSTFSGKFDIKHKGLARQEVAAPEGEEAMLEHERQVTANEGQTPENGEQAAERPTVKKRSLIVDVVADADEGKTFWAEKLTVKVFYEGEENESEPIDVNVHEMASIVTPREYIYSDRDDALRRVYELPGYPRIPEKKVAEVLPPGSDRQSFDPFALMKIPSWTAVARASDWLEGKEKVDRFSKREIHVYETADAQGARWFRHQLVDSTNEVEINVYWNESSGFQPVYMSFVSVSKGIVDLRQTKWTTIGGVFLPIETYEITNYGDTGNHCRMMKVSDIRVNESLSQAQFSFNALGLVDGDLVLDGIQNKVYKIKKGEPVFFAMYGTPRYLILGFIKENAWSVSLALLSPVLGVASLVWFLRRKNRQHAVVQKVSVT